MPIAVVTALCTPEWALGSLMKVQGSLTDMAIPPETTTWDCTVVVVEDVNVEEVVVVAVSVVDEVELVCEIEVVNVPVLVVVVLVEDD
jgi:hypothetical protein